MDDIRWSSETILHMFSVGLPKTFESLSTEITICTIVENTKVYSMEPMAKRVSTLNLYLSEEGNAR